MSNENKVVLPEPDFYVRPSIAAYELPWQVCNGSASAEPAYLAATVRALLATGGQAQAVTKDEATWCSYIAGMIGCYLKEEDESPRVKAIAGIIERRLWALPSPQAQADARDALTPAARDVLAERQRQRDSEGWTLSRDDGYTGCELAAAAACYAVCDTKPDALYIHGAPAWPWGRGWWNPTTYRRNLEKSGALILAEIERIDRAAIAAAKGEQQ